MQNEIFNHLHQALKPQVSKHYNKLIYPSAAYMRQWNVSALAQIMACRLFGDKTLSKPMLSYCQWDP